MDLIKGVESLQSGSTTSLRCTIMASQDSNLDPNLETQRQLQSWRKNNWLTKIKWNFFLCKWKFCALDMGRVQFL
jgi:hypothetical protein